MDRNREGWLGTWGGEEAGTQGEEGAACSENTGWWRTPEGGSWGEWVSPRLRLTASGGLGVQVNPHLMWCDSFRVSGMIQAPCLVFIHSIVTSPTLPPCPVASAGCLVFFGHLGPGSWEKSQSHRHSVPQGCRWPLWPLCPGFVFPKWLHRGRREAGQPLHVAANLGH